MRSLYAFIAIVAVGCLAPLRAAAQFSTQAKQGYCYECVGSGGCLDCAWPVSSGHTSCIPYCNGTCAVGGACGTAFLDLELAPDGTARDDGIGLLTLQESASTVTRDAVMLGLTVEPWRESRNCRGLVLARRYLPPQLTLLHESSRTLVL